MGEENGLNAPEGKAFINEVETNLVVAEIIPNAAAMIQSMRSIGYSFEMAIADIIDNSITANAANVWIDFNFEPDNIWFSIKDDGNGMTRDELFEAMRPGSKNPIEKRDPEDLGRFGLGLKTASFSQCKRLTVFSKKNGDDLDYWTWDLDHIQNEGKWQLIKNGFPAQTLNARLPDQKGTLVLWEKVDRFSVNQGNNDRNHKKLYEKIESLEKHLSMIFHRFISSKKLNIHIRNRKLEAWDPFMESNTSTQAFPVETLNNTNVRIKGFVLPHPSKITEHEYNAAAGINGWIGMQGFYLYRNDRIILFGSWMNLFRKDEHYKLTRIRIDLNNESDHEWQIDIKKCSAITPLWARDQLRNYALHVRNNAVNVYRHRGTIVNYQKQQFVPFWNEKADKGKWYHIINREHPVVLQVLNDLPMGNRTSLENLLKFIEATLPSKSIYIKEAEASDAMLQPTDLPFIDAITALMRKCYNDLRINLSVEAAKQRLHALEPFNQFKDITDAWD